MERLKSIHLRSRIKFFKQRTVITLDLKFDICLELYNDAIIWTRLLIKYNKDTFVIFFKELVSLDQSLLVTVVAVTDRDHISSLDWIIMMIGAQTWSRTVRSRFVTKIETQTLRFLYQLLQSKIKAKLWAWP